MSRTEKLTLDGDQLVAARRIFSMMSEVRVTEAINEMLSPGLIILPEQATEGEAISIRAADEAETRIRLVRSDPDAPVDVIIYPARAAGSVPGILRELCRLAYVACGQCGITGDRA